ncbi:expressed unknown protein [Seminavis robusta]|uniref:Uncharacterized protein n=1 Tax=Seminavis robusta TaxID=568900 RepID=A0A9N8D6D1_9STRA|nr:expressed unknown protein [Seminavis robusta]|eukprot:Sro1_g000140.1 n/a (355) ;mRNA; r:52518-53582
MAKDSTSKSSKHGKKHSSDHKDKTESRNEPETSSSSDGDILDGSGRGNHGDAEAVKEKHEKHKHGKKHSSKTHKGGKHGHKHHNSKNSEDENWNPDYHWETHCNNNDSSSKSAKKIVAHSNRVDKHLKKLYKLEEDITGTVFDSDLGVSMVFDSDEGGVAVMDSSHDVRATPAVSSSDAMDAKEVEYDEEALDMEEDEALRTTPTTPPLSPPQGPTTTLENLPPELAPGSPRAVITTQHQNQEHHAQNATIRKDPTRPSPVAVSRNSLGPESLGPSMMPRASFMPPFLMHESDSDDEEEEEAVVHRRRSSYNHGEVAGGGHGSGSSGDWAVPEAMGMDEGIPEINQERCHSLLY